MRNTINTTTDLLSKAYNALARFLRGPLIVGVAILVLGVLATSQAASVASIVMLLFIALGLAAGFIAE